MVLDRLFNFRPRWPRELPRLYPELDHRELCSFMSEAEYWRIRKLPMVAILPLYSEKSAPEDGKLGAGLSRLLIRDLMLVRDLSVRGPEDTPRFDYESATAIHASEDRDTYWVVGAARALRGGFAADLRLLRPGQSQPAKIRVQHADFMSLAAQCAVEIARAMGATVSTETLQMWRYGRPTSVEQVVRLGQLVLADRDSPQTSLAALALYQENPALSIALDFIDSDYVPERRALLLESIQNDPYYAQTYFSLFIAIWDSTGPQPHAVQFLRRAIELSPGHGKAHMCAPHAASLGVNMLPHSDLGYRLLPKNPFAINNYILYLQLHGRPISQIIPLAYAGIEADPQDPGNYDRLMEMLAKTGDFQNALQIALALQKYCTFRDLVYTRRPRQAHRWSFGGAAWPCDAGVRAGS